MSNASQIADLKKKRKTVHIVCYAAVAILYAILNLPIFVRMWDRTDIWVGVVPLSQFVLTGGLALASIAMFVLYFLDKKMTEQIIALKEEEGKKNG